MSEAGTTPPGWYDDGRGATRYWDGSAWTDHTQPAVPAPAPHNSSTAGVPAASVAPAPVASVPQTTVGPAAAPNDVSRTTRSVLGFIALAVAAVGLIFACIPGALVVGWILLPIAFVLSLVALFLPGRKWPAIAGLVVSIIGTIIGFVVFFAVVSNSFTNAFGGRDTSVTVPTDAPSSSSKPSEDAGSGNADQGTRDNPVPIGTLISGGEYDVTINSVVLDATEQITAANPFNDPPDAGSVYALVNATVTYTGDESGFAAFVAIDFVTSTGEVRTSTDKFVVPPDPTLGLDELYNGGTATGNIGIQIPADGQGLLRVRPGPLADEVFLAVH